MPAMSVSEGKNRLETLRKLLSQGSLSTQDELREKLEKQDFSVTQSTVSRDLRKIGAIKAVDADGRTVYRLPADEPAPIASTSLGDLVLDVNHNGSLIVIHTTPGSASLIARHLDRSASDGILGTLAGDDTIFVAPRSVKDIRVTMQRILESFSQA